ncbi:MAG: ferritin family protein [Clostridia bacterium]
MIEQGDFSDLEMFKIAISLEEEGMRFYSNGVKYTSGKLRDFLLHAAGQEMAHKEMFSKLYSDLMRNRRSIEDEYLFEPDVAAYLKSLVENQIFSSSPKPEDAFKDLKTAAAEAVKAEEATVLLYTKMYEGTKQENMKEALAVLVDEEKAHVEYFKNLLKEV